MDIALMVASFFATLWLYNKVAKKFRFAEVKFDSFNPLHTSFAALLAHLSLKGHVVDTAIGVALYLTYQILGYLIKRDNVLKDVAEFTGAYFATLTAQLLAFGG
jgi:hypothetical protein